MRHSMAVTCSDCGWNVSLSRASCISANKMHKREPKQRTETLVERTDRKALKQLSERERSM